MPVCQVPGCYCCKQKCGSCYQCMRGAGCKCLYRRNCCGLPIPKCWCPYCADRAQQNVQIRR
jgi:hypothetical protein